MDRALKFYRGLLGIDVVFDQTMSGEHQGVSSGAWSAG
ncbi:MAG TPA: hypothetical protein VMD51_08250 [Mycobacterium sp.]|nr:hypothetical protein [Mycobacterium sp.]